MNLIEEISRINQITPVAAAARAVMLAAIMESADSMKKEKRAEIETFYFCTFFLFVRDGSQPIEVIHGTISPRDCPTRPPGHPRAPGPCLSPRRSAEKECFLFLVRELHATARVTPVERANDAKEDLLVQTLSLDNFADLLLTACPNGTAVSQEEFMANMPPPRKKNELKGDS